MIGYHYTATCNLKSILEKGMLPYTPTRDKIDLIERSGVPRWKRKGIWVWERMLQGESHAGSILFAATKAGETSATLLEFEYDERHRLHDINGCLFSLFHRGAFANWQYHKREPAFLVTKPIPPSQIKVVATYDFVDILCQAKDSGWRPNGQLLRIVGPEIDSSFPTLSP